MNTWIVAEKAGRAAEILPRERMIFDVVAPEHVVQLFGPGDAV